nr:hypothetical protein GCM10020185_56720 [Pseudomonas brassicacearum subsp. brassicacearum]
MPNTHCPDWATALLNGFSQIFLQRHPLCGLLCLLAILLTAPALFGGALLGGVAGLLTAQRRGYAKADRQAGLFSYNGILLGLLLSLALPWSVLLPPLIIAAGGLSAMLTQQWLKRTRGPRCLPAYTAPFVGLAWLLVSLTLPPSPTTSIEMTVPNLLAAHLSGLGQVMFLGHPAAGALIAAGLLLADRRAAAWALFGSAAGLAFALSQHEKRNRSLRPWRLQPGVGGAGPQPTAPPSLAAAGGHSPGGHAYPRFYRPRPASPDGTVHPHLLVDPGHRPGVAPSQPRQRALRSAGQSP